jgi:hypothetical protein
MATKKEIEKKYKQSEKGKIVGKRNRTTYQNKNPKSFWCKNTTKSHINRGCTINFTFDELKNLADKTSICFYCGTLLGLEYGKGQKQNGPITIEQLKDWCKKILLVLEGKSLWQS